MQTIKWVLQLLQHDFEKIWACSDKTLRNLKWRAMSNYLHYVSVLEQA